MRRFVFVARFRLLNIWRAHLLNFKLIFYTTLWVLRHFFVIVWSFAKHYVQSAVVSTINATLRNTLIPNLLSNHQTCFLLCFNLHGLDVIFKVATFRRTQRLISNMTRRHLLSSDFIMKTKFWMGLLLGWRLRVTLLVLVFVHTAHLSNPENFFKVRSNHLLRIIIYRELTNISASSGRVSEITTFDPNWSINLI